MQLVSETPGQEPEGLQEQSAEPIRHFYPDTKLERDLKRDFPEIPAESLQLETRGITAHFIQPGLFDKTLLHKESIVAKLLAIGATDLAEPLKHCHTEQSFLQCNACHKVKTFWNRCDNFYCPSCAPKLARDKTDSLTWWTNQVENPIHVVLTVRNTNRFAWTYVSWFKRKVKALIRSKLARSWKGGLWSLEVTNEGKGWHLHAHLLVDAFFIPEGPLAIKWAKLVGQDFAIVRCKKVRGTDYRHEVAKYPFKPGQIAAWQPSEIAEFIYAMSGHRTFGVFGNLYGVRSKHKEWVDAVKLTRRTCECGCMKFRVYSDDEWSWKVATDGPIFSVLPNAPNPQLALIP